MASKRVKYTPEQVLAIDLYVALAKYAADYPAGVAREDAKRWLAGIRDHRISDCCATHMPLAAGAATRFVTRGKL